MDLGKELTNKEFYDCIRSGKMPTTSATNPDYIRKVMEAQLAWDISDTFNGLMMLPNLIGVLVLSPIVMKCTKNYVDRNIKHKEGIKPILSMIPEIQEEQEKDL